MRKEAYASFVCILYNVRLNVRYESLDQVAIHDINLGKRKPNNPLRSITISVRYWTSQRMIYINKNFAEINKFYDLFNFPNDPCGLVFALNEKRVEGLKRDYDALAAPQKDNVTGLKFLIRKKDVENELKECPFMEQTKGFKRISIYGFGHNAPL